MEEREEVAVFAVTDADASAAATDGAADSTEAVLAEAAASGSDQVRDQLTALQTEFAGTAGTGVPAVDEALARLGELDPDDLSGSADILSDVLHRLETVMEEAPKE